MQVRQLLTQTADSSFAPSRRRGWGLINTWEAVKLAKNLTSINGNSHASIIKGYELSQNIPNPFNPSTVISYSLKANSNVSIKIYNILGSEVSTLVNERQNAGSYSVDFNGSNLSSGVYFYSLIADGNFIGTKRMLLLK
ncbi:MAG: T9SS type A sorting domain-containing protein [Ignavibacteria bacterium]|nr:T9SS type A sorting domain-containing protein [Ignavibacteria bacterium]